MNSHLTHKCQELIRKFMDDPLTYDFRDPVIDALDPGESKDEYRRIVKQPMDLKTLESNVKNKRYETPKDFYRDFRLIFENAILFNESRYPLLAAIASYLLKRLEKEYSKRFEKGSTATNIAYLYSQYLQILSEKTQNSQTDLVEIYKLGKMFAEPSLNLLSEKLNSLSTKENFAELCEIIGKNPTDEDLSVEIADLTRNQIEQLWNFVKKYDKPQSKN